ncbi:MAG: Holliday junction DNA helicase RuvA [Ignavibacteria bacterium GWB2_35_12]|nr:MAG: Holliday junction DNA helicase RuvA [Ignavibacteria bacterium GWA2_35_8]OGU41384.1 MAG: Holliday junction DNA helicase RuvA [Ignavibacteria bacterium GWB2_35_12]OGU95049.1 MAG: Holliday junction DNA helicase RuvA [Ignavibacteria bacterium RIFOXYA2_FULL_35_10]OGV19439.1 MAG: Holliday junction DNA helicase RuvA [Ignavibacteria bacterium RIFOXYC2_FULL_35_21]
MIGQLNGILINKTSTEIIIDCGGVGYTAYVSVNTSESLPEVGKNVKVITLLIPKEDSLNLYAFANEAERETFKLLISISGIGPKIALGILSSVTVDDLQSIVISGNLHSLQKLPGVGKKTAERLLLELRDKITKIIPAEVSDVHLKYSLIVQEALSALVTLGYSRLMADKAIKSALNDLSTDKLTAEQLIKSALKHAMS